MVRLIWPFVLEVEVPQLHTEEHRAPDPTEVVECDISVADTLERGLVRAAVDVAHRPPSSRWSRRKRGSRCRRGIDRRARQAPCAVQRDQDVRPLRRRVDQPPVAGRRVARDLGRSWTRVTDDRAARTDPVGAQELAILEALESQSGPPCPPRLRRSISAAPAPRPAYHDRRGRDGPPTLSLSHRQTDQPA